MPENESVLEKLEARLEAKKQALLALKEETPLFKRFWPRSKKTRITFVLPRRGMLVICSMFFVLFLYLFWGLPLPSELSSESKNPVSTLILDRNGKLIYEIFEEKRRTPIKIEELPPYVAQTTIAVEDKDFYKHHGLDIRGVGRAIIAITTKQDLQGGSTITQQLVKTTLLTPERTIKRKIRELALTLIIETIYPKDKIIEMYLNNVPYGGTAWGIEAASQTYFNKPAKELTLAEAALLAGLPAAPTRYSPFGVNPDLAKTRQEHVLRRMVEDGYITNDKAQKASEEKLAFAPQKQLKAPHFSLLVKEQLVEKYGQDIVERGGLRVKTTLDLDLQDFAQETVATEVGKLQKANVRNGAALLTNPKTGEIYAMVGSKDYFAEDEDGKVNVTIRLRQPGSSIKPLNYALAFLTGKITPATVLADVPTCFAVIGQLLWCPVNYDGTFHGAVQARFALGNSYNIPAVRVLALNGVKEFVPFARKMGITTFEDPDRYGLSLTLGGGEVKMVDMAVAFGTFANGGIKQDLVTILEVVDWKGNVLEKTEIAEGDRVLPMEVAYLISHILVDNNARSAAFGESSFLNVGGHPEVSVKTGTTNDKRDNWTIGYSPEVTVAVWVGNNNNEPMSAVASGITGASPIWNRIMRHSLDKIEAGELGGVGTELQKHTHIWPLKPDGVVGNNVCATTGTSTASPSSETVEPQEQQQGCPTRFEYFLADNPPKASEPIIRPIPVFRDTGMMATAEANPEQVEIRDQEVLIDPLGTLVCLTCPIPTWSITINPANIVLPQLAPAKEE